jgi:hypothetical protein
MLFFIFSCASLKGGSHDIASEKTVMIKKYSTKGKMEELTSNDTSKEAPFVMIPWFQYTTDKKASCFKDIDEREIVTVDQEKEEDAKNYFFKKRSTFSVSIDGSFEKYKKEDLLGCSANDQGKMCFTPTGDSVKKLETSSCFKGGTFSKIMYSSFREARSSLVNNRSTRITTTQDSFSSSKNLEVMYSTFKSHGWIGLGQVFKNDHSWIGSLAFHCFNETDTREIITTRNFRSDLARALKELYFKVAKYDFKKDSSPTIYQGQKIEKVTLTALGDEVLDIEISYCQNDDRSTARKVLDWGSGRGDDEYISVRFAK